MIDECLDHRQCHISLQQGHTDLPQGILDIVLGKTSDPAQVADRLAEAFAQTIKHATSLTRQVVPTRRFGTGPEEVVEVL